MLIWCVSSRLYQSAVLWSRPLSFDMLVRQDELRWCLHLGACTKILFLQSLSYCQELLANVIVDLRGPLTCEYPSIPTLFLYSLNSWHCQPLVSLTYAPWINQEPTRAYKSYCLSHRPICYQPDKMVLSFYQPTSIWIFIYQLVYPPSWQICTS